MLDKEAVFGGLGVRRTRVVDSGGMNLIPGFIDAHIHVMEYAAGLVSVDCSRYAVQTIDDIVRALAVRAADTPHGNWVRGVGYDEFSLRDGRHPTAKDIDRAVRVVFTNPRRAEISLNFRSILATVLACSMPTGKLIRTKSSLRA